MELLWRCTNCGYQLWSVRPPSFCHCGAASFVGDTAVGWRIQLHAAKPQPQVATAKRSG